MSKNRETTNNTAEEHKLFTVQNSNRSFGGTTSQTHKRNEQEKAQLKESSSPTPSSPSAEEKRSSASPASIKETSSPHESQSNYKGNESDEDKSDNDDQTSTFSLNASPASSVNTDYSEAFAFNDVMRIQNILNRNDEPQHLPSISENPANDNRFILPPLRQPLEINTSNLRPIEPEYKPKGPELPEFPFCWILITMFCAKFRPPLFNIITIHHGAIVD